MKHMLRTLTAMTAAALTAASMTVTGSLSASAYTVHDDPNNPVGYYGNLQNYNTTGVPGYWWETARDQANMPVFDRSFDPFGHEQSRTLVFKNSENYHVVGTLLRENGSNKGFSIDNLSQIKSYLQRIEHVRNQRQNHDMTLDLIYQRTNDPNANEFGLRMYDPSHYYLKSLLDNIEEEDFTLNGDTGAYSGKLRLYDHYVLNMNVWYAEGMNYYSPNQTTFYFTELKKNTGSNSRRHPFYSEIQYTGKLPFKPNSLYFGSAESKTILNDIKITYEGSSNDRPETYYTTNAFAATFKKNTNSNYAGYLDGNTLRTEISGQAKTNFNNNKFVCAKASGNTLYIYIGKNNTVADNRWNTTSGETKLDAFLNSTGWKDGFSHNSWVVNWLNNHNNSNCTVKFMYNCTTSYTGTMFYNCTASYFRNTKLGLR